MSIIPALQKCRQKDQEFKTILIYRLEFIPAWFKKKKKSLAQNKKAEKCRA